jgi:hypothetical protein
MMVTPTFVVRIRLFLVLQLYSCKNFYQNTPSDHYLGCNKINKNEAMLFKWVKNCVCIQVNSRPTNMAAVTFSLIARIGILGNRIKKIPPTLIYNLNDRTVL